MDSKPIAGLQLVAFRDVLENVVQEAHSGLQQLAERLPGLADEERKRQMLQHLQTTRQRLQRLHVCAQWAHKAKAVNTVREVLKASQDHGAAFVHAADELFRLNEELRFCRAPLFDVSSALHIMQTGTYRLLPSIIEDELQRAGERLERPGELDDQRREQQRKDALRRVDFLLRSKLLATELPAGMRVLRVRGGQASVAGHCGQYKAQLTLVPAPRDDMMLERYRPPADVEEAAVKEEPEVMQPASDGAKAAGAEGAAASTADDQPSTSKALATHVGPTSAGSGAAQQQQRQGTNCWRWQLLSFELLPAAAGLDLPLLLPQQQQWLQQHIERHMWVAGDVEQLLRLGKACWVVAPQPQATIKEQQTGKTTSQPAPSGSLALSHLPTAAADSKGKQPVVKVEPDLQQHKELRQQQEEAEAAEQQLPQYATSPLAAMHSILCQTAGRLALFSILLSDARQLESGSWKGCLKLSRAASGSGIGLSYWHQQAVASYAELECLREGSPYQPAAPAAAATAVTQQQQVPPLVEVSLGEDGSLTTSSTPQLQHPLSGEAVQLPLPLDSASSLSADRLLLQAAAGSAAVQLAAVQAVLQRGSRLAQAGIHTDLVLLAFAGPVAGRGAVSAETQPASPLLHLWSGGSLQLSLSVQLRSGRLLLSAGPVLLESEQGSRAAAAVAATQQQLDTAQRDALTLPLPAGSSRGMLAARLAAEVVARLSLRLTVRQRMDAAAADAAACGLRRTTLPQRLLEQHVQQVALLVAPLSSNTLTLALPAFPPPLDMQQRARQRQQQQPGSSAFGASAATASGATRCFLLLDFGEAAGAADAPVAVPQQDVTAAGHSLQGTGGPPRALLAVCSCTARGTVTRVLQLAELPQQVLQRAQQPAAATATTASAAVSRKRPAEDTPADAEVSQAAAGPIGSSAAGLAALNLSRVASWCRRQASWSALRSQMLMLSVQYAEELVLAPDDQQQVQRHAIRLPKAPVLAELEAWATAQLAAVDVVKGSKEGAQQSCHTPIATLQLDASEVGAAAGAWRVDVSSAYFAHLPQLLKRHGISLVPPAPDAAHMVAHQTGLTMHCSLQKGDSVLTAVTDMVRAGMVHLCLTRMAGCMAVNPLAAGAKAVSAAGAAAGSSGANGGLALGAKVGLASTDSLDLLADAPQPANGVLPNGQALPEGDIHCGTKGDAAARLEWPLAGCGSVRLQEAGLTHMVLLVAPPPLPDELAGASPAQLPPPVRVTVSWTDSLATSAATDKSSCIASSTASTGAATAASNGMANSSIGSSGSLKHIRCCVTSEPALPAPITAALAQQLEMGRADLFLDALCLAAHSAATAAAQLTPEAQRAAGLLPGAVKLLGPGGGSTTDDSGPSSALRLRAQVQQGERAATVSLNFQAAGYTLLQLQPAHTLAANAAAASWMPPLWERLAQRVPSFAAINATPGAANGSNGGSTNLQQAQPTEASQKRQLRQAWVHCQGLAGALIEVLHAVGANAAAAST